jgi:hypothetical protein
MENYSNRQDSLPKSWSSWSAGKKSILGLLGCILLTFCAPVFSETLSCEAVFPEAAQSHQADGEISFDWNAQLLGNVDNSLAVARVNDSAWSMLSSCGTSRCSATAQHAMPVVIDFPVNNSDTDYQVVYRGSATLGTHQYNQFRSININGEATLTLAPIATAYHINQLSLGYAATLNLSPGSYWVDNLTLATASRIHVVGEGTAQLYVKNGLSFPWQSYANMTSSGNPENASKLFIYSNSDVTLQAGSEISAVVYSKNRLSIAQAKLYGVVSFHQANLGSSGQIHAQVDSIAQADLSGVCGEASGDDETPSEPPIAEEPPQGGNLCRAAFANGLQTHDPMGIINFQHNAQLHNASSPQLAAVDVITMNGSTLPSCEQTQCVASGVPTEPLNPGSFKTTLATTTVMVPWSSSMTFDGDDNLEYGQITLAADATANFTAQSEAYLIRELNVGYGSTLSLPAGDYWIERLLLEADTQIEVLGNGTARLYVKNPVYVPWTAQLNVNTEDAAKFIIYNYADIEFHTNSTSHALVYSRGQVKLNYQAQIFGGVNAKGITLDSDSHITYAPDAIPVADFGEICGETSPDPDLTPPQLQVNQPETPVDAQEILITGTVTDPVQENSGIASVILTTTQGHQITAALNGQAFSASVPLVLGENLINIEARDFSDNATTDSVTVQRISLPQLIVSAPLNGAEVSVPDITVTGEIKAAWLLNEVQFYLNDATQPLSGASGSYQFSFPVTLVEGTNVITLRAVTPDGDVTQSIQVTYAKPDRDGDGIPDDEDTFPDDPNESADLDGDGIGDNSDPDRDGDGFTNEDEQQAETNPNDANDYPDRVAPLLQITNASNEATESSTVVVQGTVSDPAQPYSGIQSVILTSDRFAEMNITATITDQQFLVEIPLAVGANMLTATATDLSGNTTQVTHQVQRISPPQFRNITPANGAVVTEDTIIIAGQVQTLLPLEAIRFYINEWQITPDGTAEEGVYAFSLPNIPLQHGQNVFLLRVETADGTDTRSLTITYTPEDPDSIGPPELSIVSPTNGSQLRDSSFRFKGRVISHAGFASVTVDGVNVAAPVGNLQDYYFEQVVSFPEGVDTISVEIEARDALDKTSTLTAQYHRDGTPPQIILGANIEASPAINNVVESPFMINGSVSDTNLSSITVNDQPLTLRPGSIIGQYDFTLPLSLSAGAQAQLVFNAYDISGNRTSVAYIFQSTAQTSITPLLPGDNAELLGRGEPIVVQTAARLTEVGEGHRVVVSLNAQQTELTLAGTLASGDVSIPAQAGIYILTYQVLDASNAVVASATRQVRVIDETAIPVELVRHAPENNAHNIEPNQPIELYFNKAIDLSKLTLAVSETLHGNTYLNLDPSGADFLTAQGYQLQEVHRDNEIVPGAVSVLPGNQSLAFYANRHFGFHADVYVDVIYDGEELGRFNFKVRQLPTFIIGGVVDQFGQPLPGVPVKLVGLNRTTTTNNDGSFAFGFQEAAGNEIPGGRHELIINPDFAVPGYGTQVRTINLQQGRKNEISLSRLPELHPDIPFQLISAGQGLVSLAGDELRLDLTGARLLFNNGRTSGNLQVQFMPYSQLNAAVTPGAWPQWMFAGQPRGVAVENPIGIDIKVPMLANTYDYIPPDTKYVVLLGYNPEQEVIEPVGIGRIENYRVLSVGKINLSTLDYIGYALVDPSQQPLLQEVVDGTKTLQQLLSALQQ